MKTAFLILSAILSASLYAQDYGISLTISSGIGANATLFDDKKILASYTAIEDKSLSYGFIVPADLRVQYEGAHWRLGVSGSYRYIHMNHEKATSTVFNRTNSLDHDVDVALHVVRAGLVGGYDIFHKNSIALGLEAEFGYYFFVKNDAHIPLLDAPQLYGTLAVQGSWQTPIKGMHLIYAIGLSVQGARHNTKGSFGSFTLEERQREIYLLPEAKIGIRKTFAIAGKKK